MFFGFFLKKERVGYSFEEEHSIINYLLCLNDFKMYGRTIRDLKSSAQVVQVILRVRGMQFELDKYAVLLLKQGEKFICEGM